MADVTLVTGGAEPAPLEYTLPGAQEIVLKAVTASFDGAGAGGSYVPTLQILAPNGLIVASCPIDSPVAAGASADVSWFPRGGVSSSGGGGGGNGLQYNIGTYGPDNEGDWFFAAVNSGAGGPNGFGWQFDTGSSDRPTGFTGDGGLIVDTAGNVLIDGGSGTVLKGGMTELDLDAGATLNKPLSMGTNKITDGAAGTAPTDFAIVSQLPAPATPLDVTDGSTSVTPTTTVTFTNATVTDLGGGNAQVTVTGTGLVYGTPTSGSFVVAEMTGDNGAGLALWLNNTSVTGQSVISCDFMPLGLSATEVVIESGSASVQLSENDGLGLGGIGDSVALYSSPGVAGTVPVPQAAAITKPAGGATVDSQARTAIDAIIDAIGATLGIGITA